MKTGPAFSQDQTQPGDEDQQRGNCCDAGIDAVYSYAGRVQNPAQQPLPTRVGGFGGADGLAAMTHGAHEAPPLSKYYPAVNPELEKLILKCIEPEPNDRPQSMEQILKALQRLKSEDV